jgi:CNP1-like family
LRRGLLAAAAALAGCAASPGLESDWERTHLAQLRPEEQVVPPRYPREADLVELDVRGTPDFRFFVDAATLSLGRDGVVRYALVARSRQGADNVTFEGLRCLTREYRVYAIGGAERTWATQRGRWQPARAPEAGPARRALERDYLCPDGHPVYSAAEALAALRSPRRTPDTGD